MRLAVVTFEDHFLAGQYAAETGLTWPLLVDGQRTLYRAYGMGRTSTWRVWGPATWWAYARELLWRGQRRHRPERTGAAARALDWAQAGGDVLIDPAGVVRLHRVGSGPADRPAVDEILAQVSAGDPGR